MPTLPLMQRPVRINESTYNLVALEAKRRKSTMSKTIDALIVRGLELDSDTPTDDLPSLTDLKRPAAPAVMNNANLDGLRRQIREIEENDRLPDAAEDEQNWRVYVEMTGDIIRDGLTRDEAEDFLSKHNVDGDLQIGRKP